MPLMITVCNSTIKLKFYLDSCFVVGMGFHATLDSARYKYKRDFGYFPIWLTQVVALFLGLMRRASSFQVV